MINTGHYTSLREPQKRYVVQHMAAHRFAYFLTIIRKNEGTSPLKNAEKEMVLSKEDKAVHTYQYRSIHMK